MTRLILSAVALALLAGCGVQGGLERPDPLWGDDAAARERARLEEERAEAERRRQQQQPQAQPAPAEQPAPAPQ